METSRVRGSPRTSAVFELATSQASSPIWPRRTRLFLKSFGKPATAETRRGFALQALASLAVPFVRAELLYRPLTRVRDSRRLSWCMAKCDGEKTRYRRWSGRAKSGQAAQIQCRLESAGHHHGTVFATITDETEVFAKQHSNFRVFFPRCNDCQTHGAGKQRGIGLLGK